MSIRLRITIAILVIGLLPMAAALMLSNWSLRQINETSISNAQTALEKAGQEAIREKAESVAAQIKIYLQNRPRLNAANPKSLQADANLASIAVQPVGQTGYTALHNDQGINIFHTNPDVVNSDLSALSERLPQFWTIVAASLDGIPAEGYYDWLEPDNSIRPKYMVVVPVPETPLRVAATTYIDEFTAPTKELTQKLQRTTNDLLAQLGLLTFIGSIVAIIAATLIGMQTTTPLIDLAHAAERVTKGEWDAIQPLNDNNEVGTLSRSIHNMTGQLRNAIENLEGQVKERTHELAHRSTQLEATTIIIREVIRARKMEQLVKDAVELIRDRFDFDYAGIFLVDESSEQAILVAAAGEMGGKMLDEKRPVKLDEANTVSAVITTGYNQIVQRSSADAKTELPSLLPDMHFEVALPLKAGSTTIGMLDVQSVQLREFNEEDLNIMQVLADQLGNAIENLRLLEQMGTSYEEKTRGYEGQSTDISQLWPQNETISYEYDRFQVQPIGNQIPARAREQLEAGQIVMLNAKQLEGRGRQSLLLVPIILRGQSLGVIGLENEDPNYRWNTEEISIVENIAAQTAIALENARLLEDAQQRAFQEKMVSDITSKVSSSVQIETVLRTTAQEIGRILKDTEVTIQLQNRKN